MSDSGFDVVGTTDSQAGSGGVRYFVLFATFLSAVLLYLDRFCMNYAQRYVKEDLGLNDRHISWCMSAFFLSYALAQVPSGWLTDRFGPRRMLTLYILVWSFFTAAMGWAMGLTILLAVRLGAGLGQAGAYPTAAVVVGHWVPIQRRGVASSSIAFGGRVGGAIAPLLTAALVVACVPAGTPSTLSEADLLNGSALAEQLAGAAFEGEPNDGSSAEAEEMPEDELARLFVVAELQQRFETDAGESAEADASEASALLGIINGWIEGPVIGPAEQLEFLPLEREAKGLLKSADLNQSDRERLNRLILEAVFPDDVRKIYVHGWRPVMWLYGAAGIFVAGFFFWQVRDRPSEHSRVSARELSLIDEGRPPAVATDGGAPRLPVRVILTSRSLWCLSIVQFGTNVGWVFLVTWLPRYLFDVQRVPFEQRSLMASVVMFVGWAGMLSGGVLTDRLTAQFGRRWGRALPVGMSRFVAMGAFLLVLLEPSPWTATALFALVAFSTDLGSPAVWAFNQDVGGRYIASVLGWGNMWGNLGAALSILLQERIVANWGWNAAFLTCATGFLISGVCGLLVDASKSVDLDET